MTAALLLVGTFLPYDTRPHPEDVHRFPGLEVAVGGKLDALLWQQWAFRMLEAEPLRAGYWSKVRDECYQRYQAWAKLEEVYLVEPIHKRFALGRLREVIGHDLYYRGLMPAPAPLEVLRAESCGKHLP